MVDPTPITVPAGYAPAYAIGFEGAAGQLVLVGQVERMPVATSAPAPAEFSGATSVSTIVGPFDAVADRIVSVTLGGVWEGTVRLLRSTDGGVTQDELRVAGMPWAVYTTAGCEQAWLETEDNASFYLDVQLASGTLAYKVSQ